MSSPCSDGVAHFATSLFTDETLTAKLHANHGTQHDVRAMLKDPNRSPIFCRRCDTAKLLAKGEPASAAQGVFPVNVRGEFELEIHFGKKEASHAN